MDISFKTASFILYRFSLEVSLHGFFLRYLISDFEGGSLLRIEPVRKKKESGAYECIAENGNGNPVSVEAELTVYDGKYALFYFQKILFQAGAEINKNQIILMKFLLS